MKKTMFVAVVAILLSSCHHDKSDAIPSQYVQAFQANFTGQLTSSGTSPTTALADLNITGQIAGYISGTFNFNGRQYSFDGVAQERAATITLRRPACNSPLRMSVHFLSETSGGLHRLNVDEFMGSDCIDTFTTAFGILDTF